MGILETLASLFGPAGYRVVNAPNNKGAGALARAVRPDLVITDLILRALSGIGFVRELRHDAELGPNAGDPLSAVYQAHQISRSADGREPFTAGNKFERVDGLV